MHGSMCLNKKYFVVFSDVAMTVLMQRWIKQLEDESCSVIVEDGTESTSSQQSTSSRSTPIPHSSGMYTNTVTCTTHVLRPTDNETMDQSQATATSGTMCS